MKIIYELDTDKDSGTDIARMSKNLEIALALWDFSGKIRNWVKYDERESIPTDEIANAFYEVLEDKGIILDELIE